MRQRREFVADPGQARRIMHGIAIELELEVAGAGVFVLVGNAALALDLVVHADGVADRDALQPLTSGKKARDIRIREIARQPRVKAGDIAGHAVEEALAGRTQQRIQDRLVDFRRPVGGCERRDIFAGTGLDLRADAGRVQAERGLEPGMRQIEFPRDQQRAPQFRDRFLRCQVRPLVEPFCHQELGGGASRFAAILALAFNLDLDARKHLRRGVDDDRAKPERPGKRHRAFEEGNIPDG